MVSFSIVFCKPLPEGKAYSVQSLPSPWRLQQTIDCTIWYGYVRFVMGGWACLPLWRISWVLHLLKGFKQTRAMTGYDHPKWSGKSSLTLCGLTNSQLLEPQKLGLEDACPIGCCHSWALWNFSGGFNPERYETVGIIQGFQKMIERVWSGWTTRHGWILVDFPASKDKSPQLASRFSPRYWGTGLEMWKALNIL